MWNPRYGPMPMEFAPDPMYRTSEWPLEVLVGPPPIPGGGMMYPVERPAYGPTLQRGRPRREERRSRSAGRHHRSADRSRRAVEPANPLHQWSAWRTGINEGLGRDIMRNTYREIPIGKDYDDLVRPPPRTRHGVYHYSTAVDQATRLQKEDFINFGIPRAQIPKNSRNANRDVSSSSSSTSSSSESEEEKPFYSIKKMTDRERIHQEREHSNAMYHCARYDYSASEDQLMMNGRREHSRGRDISPDRERHRHRHTDRHTDRHRSYR